MPLPTEILEKAIQLENDGEQFYREHAKDTDNPLAQKTFEWLADEEVKHRQLFETIYGVLQDTGEWPSPESLAHSHTVATDEAKQLFAEARKALDEQLGDEPELEEAYATAMDFERQTIDLYRDGAENAEDNDEQAVYEMLVEEERSHLNLLATTQEFLFETDYWFFKEEQWIVTG